LIHILEGIKTFEVRKNDRDYQVGDNITFSPLEDDNYDCYKGGQGVPTFKITYVYSGYGVNQGWVVLGLRDL
jgi:hypothetical protein